LTSLFTPDTTTTTHHTPSQTRLEAARSKATSIASQDDVPLASKMREIEKV
jgi:hypothetical protein